MIENVNASKKPVVGDFTEIEKYIGVASVNILAINPDNEKLRKYGWNIPEGSDEPNYILIKDDDGKEVKTTKIRFLAQIQDLDDKPVIPLDFYCRPEMVINQAKTKCKIIDAFGRTAWGTKEETKNKKIPIYSNGAPASISLPYKPCHPGEEEIITLLFKYLNITPLQIYDRKKGDWIPTKNPGRLTIDDWMAICDGNIKELASYIALQPENRVKVVLGVRTTEDNKTYQTFLNTTYIGNGALPDRTTGEYTTARKAIDKFYEGRNKNNPEETASNSPYVFTATPVHKWKEDATTVSDNAGKMFDDNGNYIAEEETPAQDYQSVDDDYPF